MPINPAFHRFPAEAAIIGRLLTAFGELEISVCYNASKATEILSESVLIALYRLRNTASRIEVADALMRPTYERNGVAAAYEDAMSRVRHCLRLRNQFAHCNWADHEMGGLFFADLQASAKTPDFWLRWKHIDLPLLRLHETYFEMALEALRFADHEIQVKFGRLRSHVWPKPPALAPPPLHNPEAQHIPPWIGPDAQAHYSARIQEAEQGTMSPKRLAQEQARAEKLARRQADRDASKRLRPESEK